MVVRSLSSIRIGDLMAVAGVERQRVLNGHGYYACEADMRQHYKCIVIWHPNV